MAMAWDEEEEACSAPNAAVSFEIPQKKQNSNGVAPTQTSLNPDDADLLHLSECTVSSCPRCCYAKRKESWSKRFPLITEDMRSRGFRPEAAPVAKRAWLTESWLAGREKGPSFGLGCVACAEAHASRNPYCNFEVSPHSTAALNNFGKHHTSKAHFDNVLKFFEVDLGPSGLILDFAPSADEFKTVWLELRKGIAPSQGVPSVGGGNKVSRMAMCLSEAQWSFDRDFVRDASCLSMTRDERAGRLLIRFQACKEDLTTRTGIFGQINDGGTGAVQIAKGTMRVVEQFCTVGKVGAGQGSLDQDLKEKVLAITEAITVDSASDELLAGVLMAHGSEGEFAKVFHNHKATIRDKTHASRKIIERPAKADPYLHQVSQTFLFSRESITQRIQHSREFSSIFEQKVHDIYRKTAKNLRAAKHRFESWSTPAARFSAFNDAINETAARIISARRDEKVADDANAYFMALDEESRLSMAMLADYSHDCLVMTRMLDNEDVETSELQSQIADFSKKLLFLYQQGHCKNVGYTKQALAALKCMRLLKLKDGSTKSLGGPGHPKEDVLQRCLDRMACLSKLALVALKTEFPSFDLLSCFSVLALSTSESKLTAKLAAEQDEQVLLHLKKLAQVFDVDLDALREEVGILRPIARRILLDTKCTTKAAWRQAFQKAQRHAEKAGEGATFKAIRAVLLRHACFCASTSGVEQNFSSFDRLFGNQRLGSRSETEINIMKLMIDSQDKEEHDMVVQRARETWVRHFGLVRHHHEPRIDKGCARTSKLDSTGTVASMSRKRLREVEKLMEEFVDEDISEMDIANLQGWSDGHAAELEFQQSKRRKIKVEALRDGHLVHEEMDMEVQADAEEQKKKDKQNRQRRVAKATRVLEETTARGLDKDEMRGMRIFMEDTVKTPELVERAGFLLMPIVNKRMEVQRGFGERFPRARGGFYHMS